MTRKAASSIFALAFAVSAGTAAAADQGFVNNATGEGVFARPVAAHSKSRDQVRAELAEAVRAGNVIANNATGETVRSAGADVGQSRVTREQVKAELAEAIRNGDVIANNATLERAGDRS
jgi:hypothetical protein